MDVLERSSFDAAQPALLLCEGLLYYLDKVLFSCQESPISRLHTRLVSWGDRTELVHAGPCCAQYNLLSMISFADVGHEHSI